MKTITQFQSIESFSTDRLYAKKIHKEDLDKFLILHANEAVMATLGGLRTEQQTKDYIEWNVKKWEEDGFGLWLFYLKETDEWVGRGGLRRLEVNGQEEVEVAYALMPAFWHQ